MKLETLDSYTWSFVLGAVIAYSLAQRHFTDSVLLTVLLILSWIASLKNNRPTLRRGAGPQIVGGLISVPAALSALNSDVSLVSFSVSISFSLVFSISSKQIPSMDLPISVPVACAIPGLISYFFDEEYIVTYAATIFAFFVVSVVMKHAPGSFSIGEGMMVSTLCSLPIKSLFCDSELPQFSAAFIIGGIFTLCVGLVAKIRASVLVCVLPFYFIYKNFNLLISYVFSKRHFLILLYCGSVCGVFILGSIFWKGLQKFPQIVQRKFFHIMALLVFVVPVVIDSDWMKLALSGAIYIFLVVEAFRIIRFPFIAQLIETYVSGFVDERDSGELILTHLFLLLGCGLPVLLCSNEGNNSLAVKFCGISVLAIGDAAASAIGVKFGKHKWPGSKKSFEGTIGAFVGTWITIVTLTSLGAGTFDVKRSLLLAIPSLVGAFDEAFTSQIDNLTLPFVILPIVVIVMNV